MKKLIYIIIFILLIVTALLYKQLLDYQNISSSLLKNNTDLKSKISTQQKNIDEKTFAIQTLTNDISNLNDKVISLEQNISNMLIVKDINFTIDDTNNSILINNLTQPEPILDTNSTYNLDIPIVPTVQIEQSSPKNTDEQKVNENKITGFGLEYSHEF
jgi:hypothetical protein